MIMRGCELSSQSALGGGSEQPCSSLRQLAKRHRRTIGTEASGVAVKRERIGARAYRLKWASGVSYVLSMIARMPNHRVRMASVRPYPSRLPSKSQLKQRWRA